MVEQAVVSLFVSFSRVTRPIFLTSEESPEKVKMPLESTMICLDNSEWMRNGDYIPSRLEAQHDAANLLCGTKTQSNPESTVGVLAMAGKSIQVLASPTDSMGTLLSAIHRVEIGGTMKLANAIQVAQLALKHRRNKTGGQRVVVFIGSPIEEDEKQLTKIGKLLKKNNIAVDVVSMGELDANAAKLQAFVDAASSNNNSHLVTVPAGVLPSDVLVSSPVLHGDDGAAAAAASGGGGGDGTYTEYGGVDPSMDPELALALRVSMEEERARQEAAQKRAAEAEATAVSASATPAAVSASEQTVPAMEAAVASAAAPAAAASSMPTPAPAPASNLPFMDPKFVNSLLSGLPGVDPNDPKIQAAMAQLAKKDEKKKDGNDEEKKEDE
uniref:26S proteasome regulatory subunit RPN10 n=1 Tax=Peronospora matthiolae TaxID=2874970 RepID=A0AAV1UF03_9STRA